jgi:putative thiamine transport system ATP-binding protein
MDGSAGSGVTLQLRQVGLRAGGRVLLADLTLDVAAGEVVTLMGPSGAGKSSLLAYIAGTLPAGVVGTGAVCVAGANVTALPAHRRRIGILFQDDLLFPHMSAGDNLLFGLHPSVRGRAARRAAMQQALIEMELPGIAARDPAELSGGQRARVALARVLLAQPAALLLDEPFSGLDVSLRARMRALLLAQVQARGLPSLLVTHDPLDALGTVLTFPTPPDSASTPPSGR